MDRLELLTLMRQRHGSGVNVAAMTRDPEAYEHIVDFYAAGTDPIFQLPGFPLYGKTPEEDMADRLQGELERIVINHFLRQYSRDEMLFVLRMLNKASEDGTCTIGICPGISLSLRDVAYRWSKANPDETPIRYLPADPDIG